MELGFRVGRMEAKENDLMQKLMPLNMEKKTLKYWALAATATTMCRGDQPSTFLFKFHGDFMFNNLPCRGIWFFPKALSLTFLTLQLIKLGKRVLQLSPS